MRREFVEAMVDVGKLRWGAVDLRRAHEAVMCTTSTSGITAA